MVFVARKVGQRNDRQRQNRPADYSALGSGSRRGHRIVETVDALLQVFDPQRQLVLGRELTKLFETIHRCPLAAAPTWLAADVRRQRGEFVMLVEGAEADVGRILQLLLAELPVSQAVTLVAQITGQKNALHERALQLRNAAE